MAAEKRAEWMELSQKGDERAYKSLLRDIVGPIKAFAQQKVGFLDAADDIVQESLLAIHKARHTYDPKKSFDSWMFAIVRYKIIDFYRKESKRQSKLICDENLLLSLKEEQDKDTPSDERLDLLPLCLESLPKKYQEALHCVKIQETPIKEAAKILGISEANVKTRCSRGYKMLLSAMRKRL